MELRGNVFRSAAGTGYLPLYEAKMLHHYTHRWCTYVTEKTRYPDPAELQDPDVVVLPRYWVPEAEVQKTLQDNHWQEPWLMGWRDITNATNARTVIASILPRYGVGHKFPLCFSRSHCREMYLLLANLDALVFDHVARQKIGGTDLTYGYLEQLPVLPPAIYGQPAPWQREICLGEWIRPRVLELVYTTGDLRPWARSMGYEGDPFIWNEDRRAHLRAELDAAFFHLYLPAEPDGSWKRFASDSEEAYASLVATFATPRQAVEYIMKTFADGEQLAPAILQEHDALLAGMADEEGK